MTDQPVPSSPQTSPIPADDPSRIPTVARPDTDAALHHIGIVGDTYTVLLSGAETADRYCLIDMLVPPGGSPGTHCHDFEEAFTVIDGKVALDFRGEPPVLQASETANMPTDAPHRFHNASGAPMRLLRICSPAGQEAFFAAIGRPLASRTEPPPAPRRGRSEGVPGAGRRACPDLSNRTPRPVAPIR